MSNIELIHASSVEQEVDAIVNAANNNLWSGGGVCGVIFKKAGYKELTNACKKVLTPLNDGEAVITSAFNVKNAKYIIHAVGPDFTINSNAFEELFMAYYNSMKVLMENNLHSISFPLISSGIFAGKLENPVNESVKQCVRAYKEFNEKYKEYEINVKLCAFSNSEMYEAEKSFNVHKTDIL